MTHIRPSSSQHPLPSFSTVDDLAVFQRDRSFSKTREGIKDTSARDRNRGTAPHTNFVSALPTLLESKAHSLFSSPSSSPTAISTYHPSSTIASSSSSPGASPCQEQASSFSSSSARKESVISSGPPGGCTGEAHPPLAMPSHSTAFTIKGEDEEGARTLPLPLLSPAGGGGSDSEVVEHEGKGGAGGGGGRRKVEAPHHGCTSSTRSSGGGGGGCILPRMMGPSPTLVVSQSHASVTSLGFLSSSVLPTPSRPSSPRSPTSYRTSIGGEGESSDGTTITSPGRLALEGLAAPFRRLSGGLVVGPPKLDNDGVAPKTSPSTMVTMIMRRRMTTREEEEGKESENENEEEGEYDSGFMPTMSITQADNRGEKGGCGGEEGEKKEERENEKENGGPKVSPSKPTPLSAATTTPPDLREVLPSSPFTSPSWASLKVRTGEVEEKHCSTLNREMGKNEMPRNTLQCILLRREIAEGEKDEGRQNRSSPFHRRHRDSRRKKEEEERSPGPSMGLTGALEQGCTPISRRDWGKKKTNHGDDDHEKGVKKTKNSSCGTHTTQGNSKHLPNTNPHMIGATDADRGTRSGSGGHSYSRKNNNTNYSEDHTKTTKNTSSFQHSIDVGEEKKKPEGSTGRRELGPLHTTQVTMVTAMGNAGAKGRSTPTSMEIHDMRKKQPSETQKESAESWVTPTSKRTSTLPEPSSPDLLQPHCGPTNIWEEERKKGKEKQDEDDEEGRRGRRREGRSSIQSLRLRLPAPAPSSQLVELLHDNGVSSSSSSLPSSIAPPKMERWSEKRTDDPSSPPHDSHSSIIPSWHDAHYIAPHPHNSNEDNNTTGNNHHVMTDDSMREKREEEEEKGSGAIVTHGPDCQWWTEKEEVEEREEEDDEGVEKKKKYREVNRMHTSRPHHPDHINNHVFSPRRKHLPSHPDPSSSHGSIYSTTNMDCRDSNNSTSCSNDNNIAKKKRRRTVTLRDVLAPSALHGKRISHDGGSSTPNSPSRLVANTIGGDQDNEDGMMIMKRRLRMMMSQAEEEEVDQVTPNFSSFLTTRRRTLTSVTFPFRSPTTSSPPSSITPFRFSPSKFGGRGGGGEDDREEEDGDGKAEGGGRRTNHTTAGKGNRNKDGHPDCDISLTLSLPSTIVDPEDSSSMFSPVCDNGEWVNHIDKVWPSLRKTPENREEWWAEEEEEEGGGRLARRLSDEEDLAEGSSSTDWLNHQRLMNNMWMPAETGKKQLPSPSPSPRGGVGREDPPPPRRRHLYFHHDDTNEVRQSLKTKKKMMTALKLLKTKPEGSFSTPLSTHPTPSSSTGMGTSTATTPPRRPPPLPTIARTSTRSSNHATDSRRRRSSCDNPFPSSHPQQHPHHHLHDKKHVNGVGVPYTSNDNSLSSSSPVLPSCSKHLSDAATVGKEKRKGLRPILRPSTGAPPSSSSPPPPPSTAHPPSYYRRRCLSYVGPFVSVSPSSSSSTTDISSMMSTSTAVSVMKKFFLQTEGVRGGGHGMNERKIGTGDRGGGHRKPRASSVVLCSTATVEAAGAARKMREEEERKRKETQEEQEARGRCKKEKEEKMRARRVTQAPTTGCIVKVMMSSSCSVNSVDHSPSPLLPSPFSPRHKSKSLHPSSSLPLYDRWEPHLLETSSAEEEDEEDYRSREEENWNHKKKNRKKMLFHEDTYKQGRGEEGKHNEHGMDIQGGDLTRSEERRRRRRKAGIIKMLQCALKNHDERESRSDSSKNHRNNIIGDDDGAAPRSAWWWRAGKRTEGSKKDNSGNHLLQYPDSTSPKKQDEKKDKKEFARSDSSHNENETKKGESDADDGPSPLPCGTIPITIHVVSLQLSTPLCFSSSSAAAAPAVGTETGSSSSWMATLPPPPPVQRSTTPSRVHSRMTHRKGYRHPKAPSFVLLPPPPLPGEEPIGSSSCSSASTSAVIAVKTVMHGDVHTEEEGEDEKEEDAEEVMKMLRGDSESEGKTKKKDVKKEDCRLSLREDEALTRTVKKHHSKTNTVPHPSNNNNEVKNVGLESADSNHHTTKSGHRPRHQRRLSATSQTSASSFSSVLSTRSLSISFAGPPSPPASTTTTTSTATPPSPALFSSSSLYSSRNTQRHTSVFPSAHPECADSSSFLPFPPLRQSSSFTGAYSRVVLLSSPSFHEKENERKEKGLPTATSTSPVTFSSSSPSCVVQAKKHLNYLSFLPNNDPSSSSLLDSSDPPPALSFSPSMSSLFASSLPPLPLPTPDTVLTLPPFFVRLGCRLSGLFWRLRVLALIIAMNNSNNNNNNNSTYTSTTPTPLNNIITPPSSTPKTVSRMGNGTTTTGSSSDLFLLPLWASLRYLFLCAVLPPAIGQRVEEESAKQRKQQEEEIIVVGGGSSTNPHDRSPPIPPAGNAAGEHDATSAGTSTTIPASPSSFIPPLSLVAKKILQDALDQISKCATDSDTISASTTCSCSCSRPTLTTSPSFLLEAYYFPPLSGHLYYSTDNVMPFPDEMRRNKSTGMSHDHKRKKEKDDETEKEREEEEETRPQQEWLFPLCTDEDWEHCLACYRRSSPSRVTSFCSGSGEQISKKSKNGAIINQKRQRSSLTLYFFC